MWKRRWARLTMRWSGVLLVIFVIFHLVHFTFGAVGFQPGQFVHLAVYQNVVAGFSVWPIAVFYILAMAALCLHLDHGIWSAFQTLGWNTSDNQPVAEDPFANHRHPRVSGLQFGAGRRSRWAGCAEHDT